MPNSGKGKHNSLKQKYLDKHKREYNVRQAKIFDIKTNQPKIEADEKNAFGSSYQQTMRGGDHQKVEEALYAWFNLECTNHTTIQ